MSAQPAPATDALSCHGLGCTLGLRTLFAGVGFSLAPGQWLMLTGDNGAGKSTLLRILAGLVQPDTGEVRWQGTPRRAGDPDWHATLLYQGHASGWKDVFSARENLQQQASLDLGIAPSAAAGRVDAALERVGLGRQRNLPFMRLSAGQRRRVSLARLVYSRRPLWLLDEPNTALDAAGQALFAGLLDAHLAAGGCAVVATHLEVPGQHPPEVLRLQAPARDQRNTQSA